MTSNKVVMAEARQLLDFFMRKKFTNEFETESVKKVNTVLDVQRGSTESLAATQSCKNL